MKKFTLILTSISAFFVIAVKAQSDLSAVNATTYIAGDNNTLHHATAKIVNTGSDTLHVKVMRDDAALLGGHSAYYCWGITCYPPATMLSPTPIQINPGDTNTSFICYLDPQGIAGVSVVTYNFFDMADANDVVSIDFTFDIAIGINELSNKATVSGAYPNPANGLTSISYNLNSTKDARLVISNMLGLAIKEIKLSDKQSTLIIPTSDLKSGVYFYSLVVDGKSMASKKLVVAHR